MPLDEHIRERLALVAGFTAADVAAQPRALVEAIGAFAAPVGRYRRPDAEVVEAEAPGPHGPVPLRVYRPRSARPCGAGLVWVHGGGFRAGDLDMAEADAVARELTARAGLVVVTVGYRLAVDGVHYPVPNDDVLAGWSWAAGDGAPLGLSPQRLALGGASAGASLAAGTALRLRDERGHVPAKLVLAYPTLHRELPASVVPLPADMAGIPPILRFPPETMAAMNDNYLGDGRREPYAFPGSADLAGLPPTLVLTAEYDDLRASADRFAGDLWSAGGTVKSYCERGAPHGYLNIPGLAAWDRSLRTIARAVGGLAA